MPFTSKLVLTEAEVVNRWMLVEKLVYYGKTDLFIVPAGFDTDFASVPRALWSIIPPSGLHTKAAVVHDYLYRTHKVSRKDADGIFRRIMRENEVGGIRRWTMYTAVRVFGWIGWNKHDKAGDSVSDE